MLFKCNNYSVGLRLSAYVHLRTFERWESKSAEKIQIYQFHIVNFRIRSLKFLTPTPQKYITTPHTYSPLHHWPRNDDFISAGTLGPRINNCVSERKMTSNSERFHFHVNIGKDKMLIVIHITIVDRVTQVSDD